MSRSNNILLAHILILLLKKSIDFEDIVKDVHKPCQVYAILLNFGYVVVTYSITFVTNSVYLKKIKT